MIYLASRGGGKGGWVRHGRWDGAYRSGTMQLYALVPVVVLITMAGGRM